MQDCWKDVEKINWWGAERVVKKGDFGRLCPFVDDFFMQWRGVELRGKCGVVQQSDLCQLDVDAVQTYMQPLQLCWHQRQVSLKQIFVNPEG